MRLEERDAIPSFQTLEERGEENFNLVQIIRKITGYEFNDPIILQQAFTHYSYREGCSSLERLAYNGDAVLNLGITKDQYFLYPDLNPGKLTRLRAANVDTEKLARVALTHGLHALLRHNIAFLDVQIEEFREAIGKHPLHSSGLIDAPKVLADVVEALIGAIFVDCKCSFDATWEVVKRVLEPMITPPTLPVHPVTLLQELCQRRRLNLKMWDTWKEDGVVRFAIDDECVGMAEYRAKRVIAKNRAALAAHNHILGNRGLCFLRFRIRVMDYELRRAREKMEKERKERAKLESERERKAEQETLRRPDAAEAESKAHLLEEEDLLAGRGVHFSRVLEGVPYEGMGDKIKLPPSCLTELSDQGAFHKGPLHFSVSLIHQEATRMIHAGVLDFTVEEGFVALPQHCWSILFPGDAPGPGSATLEVRYVWLPKGTCAKLPEGVEPRRPPNAHDF